MPVKFVPISNTETKSSDFPVFKAIKEALSFSIGIKRTTVLQL